MDRHGTGGQARTDRTGTRIVTVVPTPTVLSRVIVPPWCSMIP
jgi:hypothetical protein